MCVYMHWYVWELFRIRDPFSCSLQQGFDYGAFCKDPELLESFFLSTKGMFQGTVAVYEQIDA